MFVYAFENKEGSIKIGRTLDISQRLKTLQTADPSITIIGTLQVKNYIKAERSLHSIFAAYRKDGEWFSLPKDEKERLLAILDPNRSSQAPQHLLAMLGLR